MTCGSLFSGIGGLELGLEWAGMETIWQVEQDDYCTKVLNKHWPNVPVYGDITKVDFSEVRTPDVVCGGFPCQDISLAGKGAGIEGERSGLWWEMHRAIRVLRPRYAVIENVPALTHRGLGAVLGSLAEIRYDAEWQIISAAAMGAPHIRERIFIVAYPHECGQRARERDVSEGQPNTQGGGSEVSDTHGSRCRQGRQGRPQGVPQGLEAGREGMVADADGERELQPEGGEREGGRRVGDGRQEEAADPAEQRCGTKTGLREGEPRGKRGRRSDHGDVPTGEQQWAVEPTVGRLADGVPDRVDRIRGLGNAVVPQVAEFVGRHVMRHAQQTTT